MRQFTSNYPATLLCDFYKVSHREQYPEGIEYVYSTLTPRSNKYFKVADKVVVFSIQAFVKEYLIEYFNENFFHRLKHEVVREYQRFIYHTLVNPGNIQGLSEQQLFSEELKVNASHIATLHDLGYLPIKIKALKEGTLSPIRVPILSIENTHPEFFWLTNYLETLMSTQIWQPLTSATIAYQYRKLLDEYAIKTTGSTEGVQFQGHDFSMRGMSSLQTAKASGAGHLLSFVGTDTIPAILYHEEFYNANIEKELVGTSIPATEHSVMCSYGQTNEFELFKHLINDIYPNGFFSVVSDTWDFWKVVTEYLPELKQDILNRNGRVVIRPDSGDPVKIICGDPDAYTVHEFDGLIECLWNTFGGTITEQGYKVLDTHIGAIYGDSITLERARQIVTQLEAKGFASTNIVFGIGSYTYQCNTRDTLGMAVKATWVQVNGEERLIFKDPKTDDGTKKSQRGRVIVSRDENSGNLIFDDGLYLEEQKACEEFDLLKEVFIDGTLVSETSLSEVREWLAKQ